LDGRARECPDEWNVGKSISFTFECLVTHLDTLYII